MTSITGDEHTRFSLSSDGDNEALQSTSRPPMYREELLTRRRATRKLRLEFIEQNDVIDFCDLLLAELISVLDIYSQARVPPDQ
jgi:hypothetical protein